MTVGDALRLADDELAAHGIETPQVDSEFLLAHVLGCSRTALILARAEPLHEEARRQFDALVARRGKREPLAYVLGEWGFRRLTLKVDARVLVPRPETEVVVERALALLDGTRCPRVLDVGTGSGAIALAIKSERPEADVTAVDTSPKALDVARENRERLQLPIELRQAGLEAAAEGWDVVVANPPYVDPNEIDSLAPEVRDWEPRDALVGRGFHEELARRARTRWLVLEVGDGQADAVATALRGAGYAGVTISPDLAGRERVVEARRP